MCKNEPFLTMRQVMADVKMNHYDETGHGGCKNEPFLTMRHVTSGVKLNHNDDRSGGCTKEP